MMPTVALSLMKSKDGSFIVKYSGPSEFEKFVESEGVKRTFYECVLQGMSQSSAMLIENGDEMPENSEADIDEGLVDILMNKPFISLALDDKRKLLTQIITGIDMSKKNRWLATRKPTWWPEKVLFRSPNERKEKKSMSVGELDMVLKSCSEFLRVSREFSKEVIENDEAPSDMQPTSPHDTGMCVDISQSLCSTEECCVPFGYSVGKQSVICQICSRSYHLECCGIPNGEEPSRPWKCGCDYTKDDLQSAGLFHSPNELTRMFQQWDMELKNYIKRVVKKDVFSGRFALYSQNRHKELTEKGIDYLPNTGIEDVENILACGIARIGNSIPYIRKMKPLEERITFNKYVLAFEVLCYMLHREENVPLMRVKALLSGAGST